MEFLMDFAELFIGHVGVDLCGRNILVSEKLLDGAQIRTVSEKRRSKGMPYGMGRDRLDDAGLPGSITDHLGDQKSVETDFIWFEFHKSSTLHFSFLPAGRQGFIFHSFGAMLQKQRREVVIPFFEIVAESFA